MAAEDDGRGAVAVAPAETSAAYRLVAGWHHHLVAEVDPLRRAGAASVDGLLARDETIAPRACRLGRRRLRAEEPRADRHSREGDHAPRHRCRQSPLLMLAAVVDGPVRVLGKGQASAKLGCLWRCSLRFASHYCSAAKLACG